MFDLIAGELFKLDHLRPQRADLAADFINSVVHGLLEQNKNI